jgi:acetate CoA/acetoacetate CoA-transferase beta subunit
MDDSVAKELRPLPFLSGMLRGKSAVVTGSTSGIGLGIGGAMDLVAGARRVIVVMQHTAKGRPKIVRECSLPLTSDRPVDLVVTELAVIGFPDGRATLLETAEGVTVKQVLAATEADLAIPRDLVETTGARTSPESVTVSSMGEPV